MKRFPISLAALFFLIGCFPSYAGLIDMYKKGVIKLTPSPNFGKGTDWENLFLDDKKGMVVAPDGSIFVANQSQHNIFIFNPGGKLVKQFSQHGLGPGDVNMPKKLCILDKRALVVGEDLELRRISIFDLSGKFVKLLRTSHPTFSVTALKNNKIAYHYTDYPTDKTEKKKSRVNKIHVVVIDAQTGKETNLLYIEIPKKVNLSFKKRASLPQGVLHIDPTQDGNLIVGVSHLPFLKIYSPDGKLVREFKLELKPIPVTDDYLKREKEYWNNLIKNHRESKRIMEFLKDAPEIPHWDYLPLYKDIQVDSEGNILVFKEFGCFENCPKVFQAYSPEGKYICETLIDEGNFTFDISPNDYNICFTDKGIFALFAIKDSEDDSLRLVKVDVK